MKKLQILQVLLLAGAVSTGFSSLAGAAQKAPVRPGTPAATTPAVLEPTTETITTRTTTVEQTFPWGFGVATAPAVTETTTAVTAYIHLDERQVVQAYFGIERTNPFNFGVGALYKRIVAGNQAGGLHIGGGGGVGSRATPSTFFFRLTGVAGIHFELPGIRNVLIQADAGPSFLASSGNNSFSVGALSPLLGLSLVYLF